MINEIIYWELYALVVSFFNGVLLAWIYDNIRAFRRIVRHKTVVFMSVEDIIYGIYAGLSVFVMCFKVADGIIRGFIIMGILLLQVVFAFIFVKNLDIPLILSGLLGIYLVLCAYSAIGLFMSTLTSYQIVAAVGTLVILTCLNFVGGLCTSDLGLYAYDYP